MCWPVNTYMGCNGEGRGKQWEMEIVAGRKVDVSSGGRRLREWWM